MKSAFQSPMMSFPEMGNKSLPVALDFSATASIDTDITSEIMANAVMDIIQGVYVDNSGNANPLTLTFRTIISQGYILKIPAGAEAWLPVLVPKGKVFFNAATTLGVIVPLHFVSFPVAPIIWPSANVANVTANFAPNVGAWVDRSAAGTGADQIIMAANANRKGLLIVAPLGNANPIYIEFGAVASATKMGLLPGGSYGPDFNISNQAIHVLASVGDNIYAKEF